MPKRQSITQHKSESVQGTDSWVQVRDASWAEQKDLRLLGIQLSTQEQDRAAAIQANFDLTEKLILDYVVGWNWVDDDGAALPTPKSDPSIIGRLTAAEVDFLTTAILISDKKQAVAQKN